MGIGYTSQLTFLSIIKISWFVFVVKGFYNIFFGFCTTAAMRSFLLLRSGSKLKSVLKFLRLLPDYSLQERNTPIAQNPLFNLYFLIKKRYPDNSEHPLSNLHNVLCKNTISDFGYYPYCKPIYLLP